MWKFIRLRIFKSILKKNNNAVGLTLTASKTYYKAIVSKKVWHWYKDRQIGEFYRRENPEMDLYGYSIHLSTKVQS